MIASNKQRQELNDLATIRRTKLEGAHEHSKSPTNPNPNPNKNEQGSH